MKKGRHRRKGSGHRSVMSILEKAQNMFGFKTKRDRWEHQRFVTAIKRKARKRK